MSSRLVGQTHTVEKKERKERTLIMTSDKDKREQKHEGPGQLFNDLFQLNPNKSLLDTMDQFFNNAFQGGFPVEEVDSKSYYTVKANLPGVAKEDIDVELLENRLHIMIDRGDIEQNSDEGVFNRRQTYMERVITLPSNLRLSNMKATHQDGVLNISFPKKRGRRIDIE